MEPHKKLPDEVLAMRPRTDSGASEYFRGALDFALKYYEKEVLDCQGVRLQDVTLEKFFLEYVWVVHATGFNAKVVGKMMGGLVAAYGGVAELSSKGRDEAVAPVLMVCNNPQKAGAVWKTSRILRDGAAKHGWEAYRDAHLSDPVKLAELPYIGRITCYHLARNIGLLEFVKPDLHLIRMADHWGYEDPVSMCEAVRPDGMPLGIVDLVLWYAASTFGTIEMRKEGQR